MDALFTRAGFVTTGGMPLRPDSGPAMWLAMAQRLPTDTLTPLLLFVDEQL